MVGYRIYRKDGKSQIRPVVSGIRLDRDMSLILQGSAKTKTFTFPDTARWASEATFKCGQLRAVVLNEGLETLGECGDGCCSYAGPFQYTRVKHVALPRSLRVLGDCTFWGC